MIGTIGIFLWIFLAVFMLHEFEEIILIGAWKKRNASYLAARTSILTPYRSFVTTASLTCAVAEEWLLIVLITAVGCALENYFLWFGILFAFTLHLVVLHLILGSFFRRYVPGVITAALFVVPCLFMLFSVAQALQYTWQTIVLSALTGTAIGGVNLRLMHKAMPIFARWIEQFSAER